MSSAAGVSVVDVADPAAPVIVDSLHLPGVVTALTVVGNRMFVATRPDNFVRIYELTGDQSPVLLSDFTVAGNVESMRLQGNLLHIAEHTNHLGWQQCRVGDYCPRGTAIEVYDVSNPVEAAFAGTYDGDQAPMVHLRTYRNHAVLRSASGFSLHEVVPSHQ